MISSSNDGKEAEKDLVTPPRKKLKQARLSFQKLSPSVDTTSPKNIKKRKISDDSGDEIKVVKVIKPNNEQPLQQEKSPDAVVSDSKQGEKRCFSECEGVELIETKDNTNEKTREEQENYESDTSDKGVEKESEESITGGKDESNKNSENRQFENPNPEFSPKTSIDEEKSILNNEMSEIENRSDSSESDSDEVSEEDTELNDTIDDNNSSGSCVDLAKGDESCQNNSINNLETDSKVPVTPKSNIISDITKKKKLTPKQLLHQKEAAKKKEEKERLRKEKERRKAEEKDKKRKEKEEKEELRRKEKEEKEEQKRKEKEEKEKKRQAELEQKSEEKRLKEEERRKKEEQRVLEKRKKDEKKLAEEEAKRKEEEVKKKEAAAFVNFFVASKGASKITEEVKVKDAEHFMPFQVKADMRLAPVCRSNFDGARMESFDTQFKEQTALDLYLDHLRKNSYIPRKSGKTWPLSDLRDVIIIDDDDDVILASSSNEVVESHPTIMHPKAKLLLFCENRRPPYWGTWTKKSKNIRPTCPFNKDQGFFDYEVDSDDEWEEEEPGESLHGSDDEKESEDEYEVDNEFFVPHGYLSDEENCEEEEVMNPETMKAKLKFLELEFEEEMKHKTERIKPRLFGCFWASQKSDEVGARVLALLSSYRAVFQENPIVLSGSSTPEVNSPVHESQGTCPSTGSKKKKFPESLVPALIKLVHGNINGRGFLVKEFSSYVRKELETARQSDKDCENNELSGHAVSKLKISMKIKEIASWIACPDEGPFLNRMCWYVPSEIRIAYGLEDMVIPNKVWNYINAPKRELELSNTIPSPIISDAHSKPKSLSLITKFTKKMSQKERQRQLALSSSEIDLEILNDIEVLPTTEDNEKITRGDKSDKENSSVDVTPVKTGTELISNGLKKSDSSGIREKLLQFKSKSSSILPHLEHRKKVPILKSVPLGQSFSPSTSKSSCSGPQETHINSNNDNKDISKDEDCITID